MDSRASRTASALRGAVIRLASERPIDTISAVELATAAGITRRTLYNHTSSPQRLLSDLLEPELREIAERFRSSVTAGTPVLTAWAEGDRAIAEHLIRWSPVYSAGINGPSDHLSPSLSHLLSDAFESGMWDLLRTRRPDDPFALSTARFIGHGLIGAIEAWLLDEDRDPERFVRSVLHVLPPWIADPTPET